MIKAIETKYKGYRFRSRLEARWAVFFDALGYQWEYEPEGFDLGDGVYYLPDFKLEMRGEKILYVEVKPKGIDEDEKYSKFREKILNSEDDENTFSCLVSGDPVWFFKESLNSNFASNKNSGFVCHGCGNIIGMTQWDAGLIALLNWQCYSCDCLYQTGETVTGFFSDKVIIEHHKGSMLVDDYQSSSEIYRLTSCAATKARSARFEHGETP